MGKARKRRQKKLSAEPVETVIENLSHEGRGVARIEGKTVFVACALAGEKLRFKYTKVNRRFDEGMAESILEPSPIRVEPECEFFSVCGGCNLQHMQAEEQIKFKQSVLLENFEHIGKVVPEEILEPLTGPVWNYRHKARLGVKYVPKKGRVLVGFREKFSPYVADMISCKVLHESVGEKLHLLSGLIETLSIKDKIPQIEVAIGDNECSMIFRVLESLSEEDISKLIAFGDEQNIRILQQPQGPDSVQPVTDNADDLLCYRIEKYNVDFYFKANDFTQINPQINRKMIDRAIEFLDLQKEDIVLDLFCGLGNFTLPISRYVDRIIGVEGDDDLVERAKENACKNGIDNASFYKADLTQDLAGHSWLQEKPNKILIDPPRSGAIEVIPQIISMKPQKILYISCHPATLARDAGVLVNDHGYKLVKAGVMDMFPHTAHVESIALFEK